MGAASFIRTPGRLRRIVATVAAAGALSGGVVAMTAASASALPPSPTCSVQAHDLDIANTALGMAELNYDWFQEAAAAGNDADAEAYSNAMRNWDDRASTYFELADLAAC